ncbi:hypothetical protein [Ureibacillus thermosphaericus]|uniref:hypothetical protein n=1 Tax=Ureibacillus thermosphaericus TaxID=51173 RepID=UPI0030C901BE
MGNEDNFIEKLQTNFTALFKFFASNPHLTKIGFYQTEESEELKNIFSQILEEKLKERVEFSDHDIRIFINSIVGAIERLTRTMLFTKEKEPEQLASELINIYFAKELICR